METCDHLILNQMSKVTSKTTNGIIEKNTIIIMENICIFSCKTNIGKKIACGCVKDHILYMCVSLPI